MIFTLNSLRLSLWLNMGSILENVPCALEKNVYAALWKLSALYISVKFSWSNCVFKSSVSS